jgi:methyltransferase (TIGR00027 family)
LRNFIDILIWVMILLYSGIKEEEEMSDESGQSLAATARWTAGVRARESLRADRLFNDPWAAILAAEAGKEWAEHQSGDDGVSIAIRTRFFDDFLQRVTNQYAIRQVVLMAAGLDTRAFRLPWPQGTWLFELDRPLTFAYKEPILSSAGAQPTCERRIIGVDLTEPWKDVLIESGFDPRQPSAWLLEGFFVYIPAEGVTRILAEITGLATPGSWIGFDAVNRAMLTSPWTRSWVETLGRAGAPWISPMDNPEALLAKLGWNASLTQGGEKDAHFGRWPYPVMPRGVPDMPRSWFVTAQKKELSL